MKDSNKDVFLIQYQQCVEHYRMLDRLIWQVPSVTVLITSAIVSVSFGYLKDILIRCILLSFGMVLSFSMFIAVKKYRFFQYYIIKRIRRIEKELSLEPLPLVTGKDGVNPRNWVERRRAGEWLARTVLFVFILLLSLLIFNIALALGILKTVSP